MRKMKLSEWEKTWHYPKSEPTDYLGLVYFECKICKSTLGMGPYQKTPKRPIKSICHHCTHSKVAKKGLRIRYEKGEHFLEKLQKQEKR